MIHPEILKEKFLPYLNCKDCDKAGVVFLRHIREVSRFSFSQIHQHMREEDQIIYFRALKQGRLGIASTNSLDEQNLNAAFAKALNIACLKLEVSVKKDIPSFKPLPLLRGCYFPATAKMTAAARAKILQGIFTPARKSKIKFSGHLYNGTTQIAVISPQGAMNYQGYSLAGIKLIAARANAGGYAAAINHNAAALDYKSIADIAVTKCRLEQKKIRLKPGHYDVILEPTAVAEIIHWLNYIGFGAKSLFEKTGFLHKKIGRRVTAPTVTIYDFGQDKNTFALPFDFEGLAREKVYLIKQGIAHAALSDTYYARLLKTKSTGHANLPDDSDGPLGYNLVMAGGDISQQEIINSTQQAILITRFHYINGFLDTPRALMTGMTRDGTFLVKDGRVQIALKDMRFTEAILEAFGRIKHVSRERELIADHLEGLGSVYAPMVYIKDFNFSA